MSGTSRAADAVDVGLGHLRQVVVDYERQLVDVDAAGGDIRGDQHAARPRLEVVHRPHAGILRLVAVDGRRLDARPVEDAGQPVGAVFGAGEDQHLPRLRFAEQADQQFALLALLGEVDPLRDGLDHRGRRRDGHQHRGAQNPGRQGGDVLRHGGREEERLPLGGQQRQDAPDVVDEAHVEHAVGLVEDEEADGVERDVALADQVEQAPRRGHEQVDAPLERLDLRPLVDAAEDDAVADRRVARVVAAALVDLDGQFARGGEQQRPDRTPSPYGRLLGEQLQYGQREGCGLARAGLGATLQVAALEGGRYGLFLNGGGGFVTLFRDGAQQWRRES